jgi:hypothetical protein
METLFNLLPDPRQISSLRGAPLVYWACLLYSLSSILSMTTLAPTSGRWTKLPLLVWVLATTIAFGGSAQVYLATISGPPLDYSLLFFAIRNFCDVLSLLMLLAFLTLLLLK